MRILPILLLFATALVAAALVAAALAPPASADDRPLVVVSLPPQGWLVERLAGDAVRLEVALAPGESPASYDPTPRRLARLSGLRLYLAVGVPMERVLLPHLGALNDTLDIVDLRGEAAPPGTTGHDHDHGHGHGPDPHVWLSPRRMIGLAEVAAAALTDLLPAAAEAIAARGARLRADLEALDAEVAVLLAPAAGCTLLVYHPAFGYLAQDYGFTQVALEKDGLPPSPRHLADVLDGIRDGGSRTVFVQPQSGGSALRALAETEHLRVEVLDPLAADYPTNLRHIATAIAAALAPDSEASP